ncbi:hypothetical protein THAOC_06845 [Thalassiosira oceanica]|uniref:Uncharacterized protein n=1 Tax=Thalassiosira oceanica TaxID=159749 RepID=K0TE46_THAOC|nr:hypothetical protein THAOC_06845 [Thalassiosira oceanica]|eukprot:EJK71691.1 hypothetical protein THAOC_06845 [Thalassiosira oceanica]
MEEEKVFMISDGLSSSSANRLSTSKQFARTFQVVSDGDPYSDILLAVLSDVFIGNPLSTYSTLISQIRIGMILSLARAEDTNTGQRPEEPRGFTKMGGDDTVPPLLNRGSKFTAASGLTQAGPSSLLATQPAQEPRARRSAFTNDDAAVNGLSVTEEAARRVYEGAPDEEKAMLPRHNSESWIDLYHHLLMLRARLTFDQLIGIYVEYRGGDNAAVQGKTVNGPRECQAICGDHIMRAGKHWTTFTGSSCFDDFQTVGVIRPLPGWEKRALDWFNPVCTEFRQDLRNESTDRWVGDVHCCRFNMTTGDCHWYDWEGYLKCWWVGREDYDEDCTTLGMLLDLDDGTLSVYQNGRWLGALKDELAGEYCWTAGFCGEGDVSILRGYEITVTR